MSEQDMDLDTAIQLFQLVDTFDEYKEGLLQVLTRVHTQEELDRASKVIDDKKQYMIENNPEFNAIMESRKREAKQRAEQDRAVHKAQMADAMARVKGAIPYGDAFADRGLDDFVASIRFKTVDPEELERKSEEALYCPICREKDTSNNIVNNHPTCMKDMHRLVPKAELKDYNRNYRRRWKRNRKR